MTECEKKLIYIRMIEGMRQLGLIGGLTDDDETLHWTENTMKECTRLMKEKLDLPNDYPLHRFRVLRLKKLCMSNAEISEEVGLEESIVCMIVRNID